jgi:hypothetical protein
MADRDRRIADLQAELQMLKSAMSSGRPNRFLQKLSK